jgi:hypothetical protein
MSSSIADRDGAATAKAPGRCGPGRRAGMFAIAAAIALAGATASHSRVAADQRDGHGKHVLLISVDGLHASDLQKWIAQNPHSTLAQLAQQGDTYSNAQTSAPSDSFPGLLAQITGGTPKETGVFYDDTYTRNFWPTNGTATASCTGTRGVETTYFEAIDFGFPTNTIDRDAVDSAAGIDPSLLPSAMINGVCQKAYPHDFLKTNTIFNVAAAAGLYTAWSDKHPAYEIVRGPQNTGADDLYTPEINSNTPTDPTTLGVPATIAYDTLKVNAILNQIDGQFSNHGVRTTSGHAAPAVPAIFGMNFQSVSVGEKFEIGSNCNEPTTSPPVCKNGYVPGGYEPGTLAFTPQLQQAMSFVDSSVGAMVNELKAKGLWDSTELIISAKHGQSPIDPTQLHKIGDQVGAVLSAANIGVAQETADDVALIWLQNPAQASAAVAALNAHKSQANIDYIISGDTLADRFGDPLRTDRTPDLIVQPMVGTIYSHSQAKVAEHGGLSTNDRHVALLVVDGSATRNDDGRGDGGHDYSDRHGRTIGSPVDTTQIAPTILDFLGLNPNALQAVRYEGTRVLPQQ